MLARSTRRGPTLQGRVAAAFGALALLVSLLLGGLSWLLVAHFIGVQEDQSALSQAATHAALLSEQLATSGTDPATAVERLRYSEGVSALLVTEGRAYPSTTSGQVDVPASLRRPVEDGASIRRVVTVDGRRYLAIGEPLSSGGAYFELFPRADLEATMHTLWVVLLLTAAITTTIGALVGRVASRRLLRPVESVSAAARAFADGDLDTRLDPHAVPGLEDLSAAFNTTAEAFQQRVQADARFAADIGHELRTPLTTMLNAMDVLVGSRDELPSTLREPVDLLAEDLSRFSRLAVDLLEISRHDGGDHSHREPVVVAELVSRAAAAAAGRDVTSIDPDVRHVILNLDKTRLERAVTNLVNNADDHGGGCTAVSVTRQGDVVRIVVDDAGPGVPPERRERIFDRFARGRTQTTAESQGIGLGLAIVARHVSGQGGTVRVMDAPGGGARFVVDLPLRRC